jgi:hypothetical protein
MVTFRNERNPNANMLSERQRAFEDRIGGAFQGFGNLYQASQDKRQTERQMAMDAQLKAFELQKQGYDIKPEEILAASGANEPTGFSALFADAKPLPNIDFSKRTQAYKDQQMLAKQQKEQEALFKQQELAQKQSDRDFDRQYKMATLRGVQDERAQRLALQKEQLNARNVPTTLASMNKPLSPTEQRAREALYIPELKGSARSIKEAQDLKQSLLDGDTADKLIDEIAREGKGVTLFNPARRAKIDQNIKILAGKLRVPLTGPGAMTERDFENLMATIGNPGDVLGSEDIAIEKLQNLKQILKDSLTSKIRYAGIIPDEPQIQESDIPLNTVSNIPKNTNDIGKMTPQERQALRQQLMGQ